jgi:hypothetical protein
VGLGVLWERSSECLQSVGCRFGSGSRAWGSAAVRQLAGSAGEQAGVQFGRSGAGGGARFGDAPARSAVRGLDGGGGTVRQPCIRH